MGIYFICTDSKGRSFVLVTKQKKRFRCKMYLFVYSLDSTDTGDLLWVDRLTTFNREKVKKHLLDAIHSNVIENSVNFSSINSRVDFVVDSVGKGL